MEGNLKKTSARTSETNEHTKKGQYRCKRLKWLRRDWSQSRAGERKNGYTGRMGKLERFSQRGDLIYGKER